MNIAYICERCPLFGALLTLLVAFASLVDSSSTLCSAAASLDLRPATSRCTACFSALMARTSASLARAFSSASLRWAPSSAACRRST
eukprot:scaffold15313_cov28-Prasinocladus_malaysianus.AAC.1